MQGESLLPVLGGLETDDRPAPMEVGGDQKPCWQWRGFSDGRNKLLRREADLPTLHPIPPLATNEPEERPAWHLFDLAGDPLERADLAAERPDQARALFAEFVRRGWYVAPEALLGLKAATIELDPAQTSELSALGYGGGSDAPAPQSP
jgi:hypothetical protein